LTFHIDSYFFDRPWPRPCSGPAVYYDQADQAPFPGSDEGRIIAENRPFSADWLARLADLPTIAADLGQFQR